MEPIDLTDAYEEDRVLGLTEPYPAVEFPWQREPAPDASKPRQSHEDAPERTERLCEPSPADVKQDARLRAVEWARVALAAWEKALDWIDIDDPGLPADYPAEAKGIADFIERLEKRR